MDKLTITVDRGNPAGDGTAVCLRVGTEMLVLPEPFASHIAELAAENERLKHDIERHINITTALCNKHPDEIKLPPLSERKAGDEIQVIAGKDGVIIHADESIKESAHNELIRDPSAPHGFSIEHSCSNPLCAACNPIKQSVPTVCMGCGKMLSSATSPCDCMQPYSSKT